MRGILSEPPKRGEVPDVMLLEPYTEEVVPCNAAATLAAMPQPENGVLLYKKLPGDCEAYKLHVANDQFPEEPPLLAITCDTDDLGKVLDAVIGDGEEPRYANPKTGLEFEWTIAPPGFYGKPKGWDTAKHLSDLAGEDDDKE